MCVHAQVMVATAPMCWGMTLAAHLVVIMGTQYYDGAHSQGADDYPVTDLLQMMGRASRPDIDDSGKSVLLPPPAPLPVNYTANSFFIAYPTLLLRKSVLLPPYWWHTPPCCPEGRSYIHFIPLYCLPSILMLFVYITRHA